MAGKVTITGTGAATTVLLDGDTAGVTVGAAGTPGKVQVGAGAGTRSIELQGAGGDLTVKDASGNVLFQFDSGTATLFVGGTGNEGDVVVRDAANKERVKLDGGEGDIWVKDANGNLLLHFDSTFAALYVGGTGNEGDVVVRDAANKERVKLDGGEGDIWVKDASGNLLLHFDSTFAALFVGGVGNEGDVVVRDGTGAETIKLDGGQGDIILSNADCAEEFDVVDADGAAPGTVLVIGDDERLTASRQPYDRRVAGVVSGAGSYRPGIVLDRRAGGPRRPAVALVGKVYCLVDADHGAIRVGDLLVSSPTPGHAMVATDPARTPGAVLGKALRGCSSGRALIPILVTLQ